MSSRSPALRRRRLFRSGRRESFQGHRRRCRAGRPRRHGHRPADTVAALEARPRPAPLRTVYEGQGTAALAAVPAGAAPALHPSHEGPSQPSRRPPATAPAGRDATCVRAGERMPVHQRRPLPDQQAVGVQNPIRAMKRADRGSLGRSVVPRRVPRGRPTSSRRSIEHPRTAVRLSHRHAIREPYVFPPGPCFPRRGEVATNSRGEPFPSNHWADGVLHPHGLHGPDGVLAPPRPAGRGHLAA